MEPLHLTLACGDYDLTRPLIDGEVRPRGIELTVLPMPSPERHWRMWRHQEFDVCEISLCSLIIAKGRKTHPFTAIPVFPHRRFRHSYVFVRADAGIREPKDLEGKRTGLRTWQTTAVHWIRGILQDDYGVDLTTVRFYAQHQEDIPDILPLRRFHVERVPPGRDIEEMLLSGDLDAVFYPETLPAVHRGDPRVRRLWEDAKAEEIRHFRRTGCFPIMHVVVFRDEVLERHPWAAVELLRAFRQAKELAYRRLRDPRRISLAWVEHLLEEQRRVLGPDPWAYDLGPSNRMHLERMIKWAVDFELIPEPLPPEALFFPPALDEPPVDVFWA